MPSLRRRSTVHLCRLRRLSLLEAAITDTVEDFSRSPLSCLACQACVSGGRKADKPACWLSLLKEVTQDWMQAVRYYLLQRDQVLRPVYVSGKRSRGT